MVIRACGVLAAVTVAATLRGNAQEKKAVNFTGASGS
jgi:hypothetical protein